MKVYLSVNRQAPQGYYHIDPAPKGNVPNFIGSFADMNLGFSEVTDLIADNVVDLIDHSAKKDVFKYWYDTMDSGGRLIVTGKDFLEICKSVLVNDITTADVSKFITTVKSLDDLDSLTELLMSVGFQVVNQKLTGHDYMVECRK